MLLAGRAGLGLQVPDVPAVPDVLAPRELAAQGNRLQVGFRFLEEEDWAGLEREALDNPCSVRRAGPGLPSVRPGQRFQCAEAKARGHAVPLVRPAGAGFQGAA